MAIESFDNDPLFFQKKTKIKASDVDYKFNNIVNYLDSIIIPTLNDVVNEQFRGVNNPLLINSFLTNVGNGTLNWSFLTNDSFQQRGLSLNRLADTNDNTIVISDSNGKLNYLFSSVEQVGNILSTSGLFDNVEFQILTSSHLANRCVKGNHIIPASITPANLSDNSITIDDGTVTNIKFADNSLGAGALVTTNATDGLSLAKLHPTVRAVINGMVTSNMLPDNFISSTEYFRTVFFTNFPITFGNMYDYNRIFDFENIVYPLSKFANATANLVDSYEIRNLKAGSINGNRLHYLNSVTNTWTPNDADLILDGEIQPQHLDLATATLLDLVNL